MPRKKSIFLVRQSMSLSKVLPQYLEKILYVCCYPVRTVMELQDYRK